MNKQFLKLCMLVSCVVPAQMQALTVCDLVVKGNAFICGNLAVSGILNLNGAIINNLTGLAGAIGPAGADGGTTGLGTIISSIIPFSSGLITVGTTFPDPIPTTGLAMGFGSSDLLTVDAALTSRNTAFAFSVPAAGTLHDLRVSVDSVYTLGVLGAPFTFTFTIFVSPCVDGSFATAYTATGLSATATTTGPGSGILAAGSTGCGLSPLSIPVAAGDRVVIHVTPTAAVPQATITNLAFSAGVMYTPTT